MLPAIPAPPSLLRAVVLTSFLHRIRTAASLLFESLRSVVRERHTLKGAGVRVSALAGVELPPSARLSSSTAHSGAAALSDTGRNISSPSLDGSRRFGLPPPPPPAGLLDAVGSGVISVSPSGLAVVEHLGRGGAGHRGNQGSAGGGDGGESGFSGSMSNKSGGGQPNKDRALGAVSADAPTRSRRCRSQQEASAPLWRLKAARRRRQARGDKMHSLVAWATGEDGVAWSVAGGGAGGPHRGGGSGRGGGLGLSGSAPAARGKGAGRSGAVGGESGVQRASAAGATSRAGGLSRAGAEIEHGQQALGWGVKLQARALAIPASFLPKRT